MLKYFHMYACECVEKGAMGCRIDYKKGLSLRKIGVSILFPLYLKYKICLMFYIYVIEIFKVFYGKNYAYLLVT